MDYDLERALESIPLGDAPYKSAAPLQRPPKKCAPHVKAPRRNVRPTPEYMADMPQFSSLNGIDGCTDCYGNAPPSASPVAAAQNRQACQMPALAPSFAYGVSDGYAQSHRSDQTTSTNDILERWQHSAARGISIRDDPGAIYGPQTTTRSYEEGITFCDQSHLGLQYHHAVIDENFTSHHLNKEGPTDQFGSGTEESNKRLLGRRIFKNGWGGIENGFKYEKYAMHHRHHDRDISEGVNAFDPDPFIPRSKRHLVERASREAHERSLKYARENCRQ